MRAARPEAATAEVEVPAVAAAVVPGVPAIVPAAVAADVPATAVVAAVVPAAATPVTTPTVATTAASSAVPAMGHGRGGRADHERQSGSNRCKAWKEPVEHGDLALNVTLPRGIAIGGSQRTSGRMAG